MTSLEFFLKYYGNHMALSEKDKKLPDTERASRCFSAILEWLELSKDGLSWKASKPKRHASKGVSFLLITPRGYYSKYRIPNTSITHLGGWGRERLIADWDYLPGKQKPAKFSETVYAQYLKTRPFDEPFMLIQMTDNPMDVKKLKVTLDLRYVVINNPKENIILIEEAQA